MLRARVRPPPAPPQRRSGGLLLGPCLRPRGTKWANVAQKRQHLRAGMLCGDRPLPGHHLSPVTPAGLPARMSPSPPQPWQAPSGDQGFLSRLLVWTMAGNASLRLQPAGPMQAALGQEAGSPCVSTGLPRGPRGPPPLPTEAWAAQGSGHGPPPLPSAARGSWVPGRLGRLRNITCEEGDGIFRGCPHPHPVQLPHVKGTTPRRERASPLPRPTPWG